MKAREPLIKDRWSKGIEHEPGVDHLIRLISDMDYVWFGDSLCLKVGGDGDNGETLGYILDALIETGQLKIEVRP